MSKTCQTVTDTWGKRYEITTVDHGPTPSHSWGGLMGVTCEKCGMTYYEWIESGEGCE